MNESRQFYGSFVFGISIFVAIHFLSFAGSVPYFVQITGGQSLFDQVIPHSTEEVYERLSSFGAEGRREYVFRNLTTDILLPFSILPLLLLGIRRLARRFDLRALGPVLFILPFAYVILDMIENFIVIWLIVNFPEQQLRLAEALPIVTLVKRVSVFVPLVSLLGGLVILTWSRISRARVL